MSGDWVLFATGRAKRPSAHDKEYFYQPKEECYFEPEKISEQETPVAIYNQGRRVEDISSGWTTLVLPNKFPALQHGICSPAAANGPFMVAAGSGFHELVITRDHEKHFAQFTDQETGEVIQAYLDRYHAIARDNCGEYIMIFHNHGHLAGATMYHHHSQIISMPIIPTGILKNMRNAQNYFEKTGKPIYQVLLDWEMQEAKRIVYENDSFIVLCPYVSRTPYELRIFPKVSSAHFGEMPDADIPLLAQALNVAIKKLDKIHDKIDYNFFIHTAPPKKSAAVTYDFHHWHLELLPRLSIDAGLEFGTNVFVNSVDPDEAAAALRAASI